MLWAVLALEIAFFIYLVWSGLPAEVAGLKLKFKNFRTPFLLCALTALAAAAIEAPRFQGLVSLKDRLAAWSARPQALWALWIIATVFLTWQQVTEYLALEINFLPFSFFDYILYYFFHGKIHFTGQLHTWYHTNNILFLFAPFWYFLKTPWVLIAPYAALATLAIFPLYSIARKRFENPSAPFWICFLYLNYRYLQNVLQMNFCPEIFYPLFLFSAAAMALSQRWVLYFAFVVLGLSVKEDGFLYFSALGLLTAFSIRSPEGRRSGMVPGLATIGISAGAYLFITKLLMPWTGNDVLSENFHNFGEHVHNAGDLIQYYLTHPGIVFEIFFGDPEKLKTYYNLLYRLAFLPLLSPAVLLTFIPIYPVFAHSTGQDTDFWNLRFHYAAAVIPFVFIAFVFGFSNLCRKISPRHRDKVLWGIILVLVLMNGGNFRTSRFTSEDIKSIRWARELPENANVVTHGHLLPYMGYREYNYYFADPWERPYHPYHGKYKNPDYYLIDRHVNPYPWDSARIEEILTELKKNPAYETVLSDGTRTLFKRKAENADGKND